MAAQVKNPITHALILRINGSYNSFPQVCVSYVPEASSYSTIMAGSQQEYGNLLCLVKI